MLSYFHKNVLYFLILSLFAWSCTQDESVRSETQHRLNKAKTRLKYIRTRHTQLEELKQTPFWSGVGRTVSAEKWNNVIDSMQADILRYEKLNKLVKKYYQDNKSGQQEEMVKNSLSLKSMGKGLDARSDSIHSRIFGVKRFYHNKSGMMNTYWYDSTKYHKMFKHIKTVSDDYKKKYQKKKGDISDTVLFYNNLWGVWRDNGYLIDLALQDSSGKGLTYGQMYDLYVEGIRNINAFKKEDRIINSRMAELDKSYSLILKDMDFKIYVTIGRSSWDDWDDVTTEHEYYYPVREVSLKCYDELRANSNVESIASLKSVHIDKDAWNALKIDKKENWPAHYDDAAVFWIEDIEIQYFHTYLSETNGKKTTYTEEVDEEDYVEHEKDLTMCIETKPLGYFNSEAIENSTPPGLAYVGDSKYGEWRQDESGNDFWFFMGMYIWYNNIYGYPYHYTSGVYHDYRRHGSNRPYYGRSGSTRKYGTGGQVSKRAQARTRYGAKMGSSIGTRSVSGGGLRSSGSNSRSGGPSRGK